MGRVQRGNVILFLLNRKLIHRRSKSYPPGASEIPHLIIITLQRNE
jgi:hypothetical protein